MQKIKDNKYEGFFTYFNTDEGLYKFTIEYDKPTNSTSNTSTVDIEVKKNNQDIKITSFNENNATKIQYCVVAFLNENCKYNIELLCNEEQYANLNLNIEKYNENYLEIDFEPIISIKKAIYKAFGKEMKWSEYDTVVEAVDALLAGDQDAILMHHAYFAVIEGMEGYETLQMSVKMIHEFKMEDQDSQNLVIAEKPENITEEPFIVYISGNDTKSAMKGVRSDVNILAVVNPETKQVVLINTPRDYYVSNPHANGEKDKLAHCGIWGIGNSVGALETLYECDVQYYVQINFSGFTKLIDAIGGITVESDEEFQLYLT